MTTNAFAGNTGTGNPERIVQTLCFVLFFTVMNVTMFNVALPDIARDFHLLPSGVGWVVTGYSVVYAVGSLTYGKLADLYPLKRLLTVGLLLFAAGSILGFCAQTYPLMLAARLIQSAGAAAVPALVMLIPVRFFAVEERGRVMGVIASALAFSAGVGPIVGGFISGALHWRYLFLISVGTLLTLPFFWRWLPNEEVRPGSFDVPGAVFLAGTVVSFMLSITQWNGWYLLGGILLLALFALRIAKSQHPFIQPAVLRNADYRNALLSAFLTMGVGFAVMFSGPMMLNSVNQLSPMDVGLVMFPAAMSAAVFGRIGGKMADRKGVVPVLFVSLLLQLAGMLSLSTFSGYAPWIVAICLIFVNIGISFFQPSMTKLVSTTLPAEQTGVGMGIFSLNNFMAGAVSGAAVSKMIDNTAVNVSWNPFALSGVPAVFSNVYLVLLVIVVLNIGLLYAVFGRRWFREKQARSEG